MAASTAPGVRGAIVWALVGFVPEAPFRLWHGDQHPHSSLPDARTFAQQARHQGLDAQQTFLVDGKLRPVLLLQDRPRNVLREIVGLRMVRLEALPGSQQTTIREQREPSLFHLGVHESKYGLSKEMAIDLNALVRVHATAVLPRAVGHLDDSEMRVIGQRLVEHLDIDLEPILARLVEERLDQLTSPEGS
jgi:mRNA-degrading endonuclease toxin of MazEF toxin-antitoxin module